MTIVTANSREAANAPTDALPVTEPPSTSVKVAWNTSTTLAGAPEALCSKGNASCIGSAIRTSSNKTAAINARLKASEPVLWATWLTADLCSFPVSCPFPTRR